jgi:DDE superfamily endonuclease
MIEILPYLACVAPVLTGTTCQQLSRIALALIAMSGRVTMLGISRWAGVGGSYRSVQRFFATVIPWASLFWLFFRTHLYRSEEVYLLAGDEVVVTKAGKATHGLDRFYASLYGKPVPGLAFFALSLVSVQARHAFPMAIEQVIRSASEKAANKAKVAAKQAKPAGAKRRPGRPKGSKNKNKAEVQLTPELGRIQGLVVALLQRIAGWLPLTYLLLDGHFGHHNALQMARQANLHLISKLRTDSALYFADTGPYCGHGPRRKYGDKVDYRNLPDHYLKETRLDGRIQTCFYQATLLHKEFSQPLNVVILVKTNLDTHASAHVVLFSSDLDLAYDQLVAYYCLRFQIEFNFRDAKQFWGLEDFMNISPTAVTNAANLALFMVNLSYRLLLDLRRTHPAFSVLDLKALARGYRYVEETIQLLPQKPEPFLLTRIFNQVTALGQIHPTQSVLDPA